MARLMDEFANEPVGAEVVVVVVGEGDGRGAAYDLVARFQTRLEQMVETEFPGMLVIGLQSTVGNRQALERADEAE